MLQGLKTCMTGHVNLHLGSLAISPMLYDQSIVLLGDREILYSRRQVTDSIQLFISLL